MILLLSALDSLSPNAERTLKLIAKYLQNLANQVEFKVVMIVVKVSVAMVMIPQEQYMIVLNDHLKDNMEKMSRRKIFETTVKEK